MSVNIVNKSDGSLNRIAGRPETSDTWTSTATVSNDSVIFDNLSDSYAYELWCQNKIVKVTNMVKGIGTTSGIKLTYTLSGASNGDVCKLRIVK